MCKCVSRGGWTKSGCYYADDGRWSIAWRVHDAQFWGVPQRRKRIALVADFGGLAAPEVLFERKGLSWNPEPGGTQSEGTAAGTKNSTDCAICLQGNGIDRADTAGCNGAGWRRGASYTLNTIDRHGVMCLNDQGGSSINVDDNAVIAPTLRAEAHGNIPAVCGFSYRAGSKAGGIAHETEKSPTLLGQRHDAAVCAVYDARGNGNGITVPTLTGDHQSRVTDYTAICADVGFSNSYRETSPTLLARSYKDPHLVNVSTVVRRITPLECERLQGYPDGWTDIGDWVDSKGKKHKEADSPRYKALGNSIALPFWKVLIKRISAIYDRDATMASLFDGIGGFPYLWEQINGKGSAIWASEIEEFPMAVTKIRFGED